MHVDLLDWLICPVCHGELEWEITNRKGAQIESAEAHCKECAVRYPVREGIGVFISPDLPIRDLWEQVESGLFGYLRNNPEVEKLLMDSPLDSLAPADLFFRSMVLEKRGEYGVAGEVHRLANAGMYSEEYLACNESQMNYVIEQLSGANGPIVDLASGRGYLVEKMIQRQDQHVVITDFSLPVLRRDSRWLEFNGWSERASLLAFDARRTPFKNGVIKNLTSNLGLPNVENPGEVLNELRRIVGGKFLAIMHFYPPEDRENADAIRELGLTSFTSRQTTLQRFDEAGWRVKLANRCVGRAAPTPTGVVLKGAAIDALPVAETTLEWCTLEAN